MALEAGTYISDLNGSNPPAGDPEAQGADHIRLIKNCIKATFPNLTGAMTATQANLNAVTADVTAVVPARTIVAFSGTAAQVPTGWTICDGRTATWIAGGTFTTPDLRDRFLVGAGLTYTGWATGGATGNTPSITVAGHALSVAEMPTHKHSVYDTGHGHGASDAGHNHHVFGGGNSGAGFYLSGNASSSAVGQTTDIGYASISIGTGYANISEQWQGSSAAHAHTASSSLVPTLPPYYAFIYIMKL